MKQYLKKFESQVREHPDVPALCDYGGSEYTYGDVAAAIEQYHIFFAF